MNELYECSVCGEGCHAGEIDDDASVAFEHVCKVCAEQERAQHAEEDEEQRALMAKGQGEGGGL